MLTLDGAGAPVVRLEGKDVSAAIRTPEIGMGASSVSAHPPVRAALLEMQRKMGEAGGVVLEGRDIGTVVFPDAELKFFLTASPRCAPGAATRLGEGPHGHPGGDAVR